MIYVDPQSAIAFYRRRRLAREAASPGPARLPGDEMAALYGQQVTFGWPDPYGPDPVVFGAEPRVGDEWTW